MNSPPLPIKQSERSDILDVLRGFALLGIFLANSAGFSLYNFLNDKQQAGLFTHNIDGWLDYLLTAFVEGKFYSLFSLLFGIGFTIILERNQKAGRNGLLIFYRRLFFLILLGFAHIFLLWDGDILLLYGLIGLALPLFRGFSNKTLLILAVVLIFSPLLFDILKVLTNGRWNLARPLEALAIATDTKNGITEENFRTYLVDHNSYDNVLKFSHGGFFWRYQFIIAGNRIPKVLAMFLIGLVVGRQMLYARLDENKLLLNKIRRWGFIIGIPTSLAFAYLEFDHRKLPHAMGLLDTLFYAISVIPLSLAYTSAICLLWLKPVWQQRLIWLAPAGRMALTNYLLQSVIGIVIYYGVGLGWGAQFGPTIYIPIAFVVYIVLLLFSHFWLRYFQYGPFEWVWRQLTYWKRLPIRK